MTPSGGMDANELFAELGAALLAYEEAAKAEDAARRAATDATNRLNTAQRKVDEHLVKLRKGAPRGTDWNKPVHHSVPE